MTRPRPRARRSAGPGGAPGRTGTDDESESATRGRAGADNGSGTDDGGGTHGGTGSDGQTATEGRAGADSEAATDGLTGTGRAGTEGQTGPEGSGSADATNCTGDGADGMARSVGTGNQTGTDDQSGKPGDGRPGSPAHDNGDGQDAPAGSDVCASTDDGDTGHRQTDVVVHDSADDSDHPAGDPEPGDPDPDDHGPTPPPDPGTGPDLPDTPSSDGDGDGDGDGGGSGGSGGGSGGVVPGPPVEAPPERARTGIEIRIRLSTLLGYDEHPAEIPGLGPLLAGPARDTVARHHYAEWRFAITDPDGHLLLAGHTRHRPTTGPAPTSHPEPGPGPGPRAKRRRRRRSRPRPRSRPGAGQSHGGVVELQVPAALLTELVLDPPPGWERLIADLAVQYARRHHLRAALNRHPHARFPHRALRRHVEVRDRTCSFPGCRRPARKAQQDHTHEHRHGGVTVEANLGPLCVFHHAIKTAGHWHLLQPRPGTFRWTSRLRHRYLTRGEPVCPPLPDPVPPDDTAPAPDTGRGPRSAAQDALDEKPLFPEPEPEPQPEPVSDATGDGATANTGHATETDDDAPEHDPPDDPDNDEPPF